jgi:hypothetical protein
VFRLLAPCFPDESVLPLPHSTIFPVIGFLLSILRKRMADAIALIALCGIAFHVAITALSPNVSMVLVLRAFQGAIIGSCFLVSAAHQAARHALCRPAIRDGRRAGEISQIQIHDRHGRRPRVLRRHDRMGVRACHHERGACCARDLSVAP